MNDRVYNDITNFYNDVGDYIYLEYKSKYHSMYFDDNNIDSLFDMVGRYYMGGNNVPDTAGMVVDYFRMIK
jgi:hypothetical protein